MSSPPSIIPQSTPPTPPGNISSNLGRLVNAYSIHNEIQGYQNEREDENPTRIRNGQQGYVQFHGHGNNQARIHGYYAGHLPPSVIGHNITNNNTGYNLPTSFSGHSHANHAILTNANRISDVGNFGQESPAPLPESVTIRSSTCSVESGISLPTMRGEAGFTSPSQTEHHHTQPPQQRQLTGQKRAVHRIHLSSLRHNFFHVQSAAARQQCQVIVVVKADGYGHGALVTACHLVERCGADAFAVATLEEGVALRRALEERFGVSSVGGIIGGRRGSFHMGITAEDTAGIVSPAVSSFHQYPPPRIRIIVLGSPVDYPSCFDTYLHYNIELMVSGPEVAASLSLWMKNHEGRKRAEVFRAADNTKEEVLRMEFVDRHPMRNGVVRQLQSKEHQQNGRTGDNESKVNTQKQIVHGSVTNSNESVTGTSATHDSTILGHHDQSSALQVITSNNPTADDGSNINADTNDSGGGGSSNSDASKENRFQKPVSPSRLQTKMIAATLTNVTGADLAREVRQILIGQRCAYHAVSADANASAHGGMNANETENIGTNGNSNIAADTTRNTNAVVEVCHALTDIEKPNEKNSAATDNSDKSAQKGATAAIKANTPSAPTIGLTSESRPQGTSSTTTNARAAGGKGSLFCGIDDAAKASRQRELRAIRRAQLSTENRALKETPTSTSLCVDMTKTHEEINCGSQAKPQRSSSRQPQLSKCMISEPPQIRKKLRWHALVDSGMGRLGFKTEAPGKEPDYAQPPSTSVDIVAPNICGGKNGDFLRDGMSDGSISSSEKSVCGQAEARDTVQIIKELYEAEVHEGAPIEFYGMCTHMADANSTSTYTHAQMDRFRALLQSVRSAGIAVPTVSTDNSAALLTTSLDHFDPSAILSHDTRGFVRCGGAIYGQRPAFRQLRAVSTLAASVKHVAIIHKGESVGYDRAYVAPINVRIATLSLGFADGYPRELGNGVGRVSIRGATFRVAGNVCMDMMMVDLGPAENQESTGSRVVVGDEAVLWGPERNDGEECEDGPVSLADVASTLKTTQSALTCGLDKLRVQRQLIE